MTIHVLGPVATRRRLADIRRARRKAGDTDLVEGAFLLRSYADDERKVGASPHGPFERLFDVLGRGLPGLRSLGPTDVVPSSPEHTDRRFLTPTPWQESIYKEVEKARTVLLLPGTTSGVGWETDLLATMGMAAKAIMLFPIDHEQLAVSPAKIQADLSARVERALAVWRVEYALQKRIDQLRPARPTIAWRMQHVLRKVLVAWRGYPLAAAIKSVVCVCFDDDDAYVFSGRDHLFAEDIVLLSWAGARLHAGLLDPRVLRRGASRIDLGSRTLLRLAEHGASLGNTLIVSLWTQASNKKHLPGTDYVKQDWNDFTGIINQVAFDEKMGQSHAPWAPDPAPEAQRLYVALRERSRRLARGDREVPDHSENEWNMLWQHLVALRLAAGPPPP